jgi:hypothetical protein
MAKTFEKAVTGFNHNIKHKGKVYHVQTEDSGAANPHIITHLFVGGNILATRRSSYADLVRSESLSELVRDLMEEQHKEMLRNLVGGAYDNVDNKATSYQPGQLAGHGAPTTGPHAVAAAMLGTSTSGVFGIPSPPPKPVLPPKPLQLTQSMLSSSLPPEVAAARALNERPAENNIGVETLFGEDLISEKSLDEVILSYLANDGK